MWAACRCAWAACHVCGLHVDVCGLHTNMSVFQCATVPLIGAGAATDAGALAEAWAGPVTQDNQLRVRTTFF